MTMPLWLLNLSQEFWILVIILGILGLLSTWLLKLDPRVILYKIPIQILSVIFISTGIYYNGIIANEKKWKQRVDTLEKKIKEKEKESVELNNKLNQEIEDKKKIQEEKNKEILKYLDQLRKKAKGQTPVKPPRGASSTPEIAIPPTVVEFIQKCPVPKDLIDIHDQAAKRGLK